MELMSLTFPGIRTRIREGMQTRRRQRHEAMIEGIARGCRVSMEKVTATIRPETMPPSEPFIKNVMRGDVILIVGRYPMALEVTSVDGQGMTIIAREEGADPVEHRLTPGGSTDVWKGGIPGFFSVDICTLSASIASGGALELKTEITGGMVPF
jgi:hypothetical protein